MQHQGPIAGIAAYGEWVATAGYDNKLILWDARERKALARVSHDHLVNHCSFSSNGRWLVSASSDYSARIWSLPDLRLHAVLAEHQDDVDMAVFSPDDRAIATCALDRCVRIFDLRGQCLQTMRGHTGNVLSLAWMADNRHVVSSSVDGTIRTWDAENGVQVSVTDLQVRTDSVEIGADGTIYAGDDRGRIAIIKNGELHFIQAHQAGVKRIVLSEQQQLILSLSYDRTLAVWRIENALCLKEIARSQLPETVWARAATILADGRIAAGTFGSTYALFDLNSMRWDLENVAVGKAINAVLNIDGSVYTVGDAGIVWRDNQPIAQMGSLCNFLTNVGERIFTGGQQGQLFDARTGQVLYEHHSPLNCGVAFLRQGQWHLAIGSYTGEVLIFTVAPEAGLQLRTVLSVYENAVKGLSIGEGTLFSVCASTDIAWHSTDDWSVIRRVSKAHERIVNACCALSDRRFASIGRDRVLRIWDGEQVEAFQSPHPNSVKCMSINNERTKLLTGSYGGTLALFDVARKSWLALRRPTIAGISSICWDDSRQAFVAASYDGNIYAVAT